jgi:hypothetical protein
MEQRTHNRVNRRPHVSQTLTGQQTIELGTSSAMPRVMNESPIQKHITRKGFRTISAHNGKSDTITCIALHTFDVENFMDCSVV